MLFVLLGSSQTGPRSQRTRLFSLGILHSTPPFQTLQLYLSRRISQRATLLWDNGMSVVSRRSPVLITAELKTNNPARALPWLAQGFRSSSYGKAEEEKRELIGMVCPSMANTVIRGSMPETCAQLAHVARPRTPSNSRRGVLAHLDITVTIGRRPLRLG
jgi:hypothetical protein